VKRPWQIDTCYGWASDHDVVRRYLPEFYTGPNPPQDAAPARRNGGGAGTAES
jgi:hypothetical protein